MLDTRVRTSREFLEMPYRLYLLCTAFPGKNTDNLYYNTGGAQEHIDSNVGSREDRLVSLSLTLLVYIIPIS